jgi:hypothetical protein
VLTINQVFVAISLSFTGSPIHPPSRCSQVEEEATPLTDNPPMENNLYFDICGAEAATPTTQGKPGAFTLFL